MNPAHVSARQLRRVKTDPERNSIPVQGSRSRGSFGAVFPLRGERPPVRGRLDSAAHHGPRQHGLRGQHRVDDEQRDRDHEAIPGDVQRLSDERSDGAKAAATVLADDLERTEDAEHLSKVWRISWDDAKRTIDVTSQNSIRTQDPTLSRNYGTNDRMLRYK